jgi:hypothetical protein
MLSNLHLFSFKPLRDTESMTLQGGYWTVALIHDFGSIL